MIGDESVVEGGHEGAGWIAQMDRTKVLLRGAQLEHVGDLVKLGPGLKMLQF